MAFSEQYGVSAIGTPLFGDISIPNEGLFPPPWNLVLGAHGGGWHAGNRQQFVNVTKDFPERGIVGISIDYELTEPTNLTGQIAPVRFDNQYLAFVIAMLFYRSAPPTSALFGKLSGKIGTIGGSAGATLAIEAALKGTVNLDRSDCACALSANYDFSDQASLDQYEGQGRWLQDVLDYVNVADRTHLTELAAASLLPMILGATNIPAIYMVQSEGDAVGPPTSQMAQGAAAFDSIGFANYTKDLCPGSDHAQGNWNRQSGLDTRTVKEHVLDFFVAAFAAGTGNPPPPITTGFKLTLSGGAYTIDGAQPGGLLPDDARSATIRNLDPSTFYTATLIHFTPDEESDPAIDTFTTEDTSGVSQPTGAYHLLTGSDPWSGIGALPSMGYAYVNGFRGRTGVSSIYAGALDDPDFSEIDAAISTIAAHSKLLGLSIAVGIDATDAWYDIGGATEVTKVAIDLADITPQAYQPLPWDPRHLTKMQQVVADWGIHYDSSPRVSYFVVTGFMEGNEAYLSRTDADDVQFDNYAINFGYANKVEAYVFAAKAIIGYFIDAFPNTPLFWTSAKPFKGSDGPIAQNQVEDFIINETNHKCGIMVAFAKASTTPGPPIMSTFPKGCQTISASTDHSRFYVDNPDPYPAVPHPVDDVMKNAAAVGRHFIELYPVDIGDALNEDVIIANNATMLSITPTF